MTTINYRIGYAAGRIVWYTGNVLGWTCWAVATVLAAVLGGRSRLHDRLNHYEGGLPPARRQLT